MGLEDLMREITKETESIVDTKTLIGDPVTSAGKTVMPIIRVSAGFGSAGGERDGQAGQMGFAAGGYAGVNMEPIGFVVISKDDVRLLTVSGRHTFSRIVDMVPEVVSRVKEGTEVSERAPGGERTGRSERSEGRREGFDESHREFSSRSMPEGGAGGGSQAIAGRAGAEVHRDEGSTGERTFPDESHKEFSSRSMPEGGAGGGSQAIAGRAGVESRSREGGTQEGSFPDESHREFSSRSMPEGGAGGGSQATAGRAGAESSRSRRRGSSREEEC
ncbi:spore germination protein GerW family protein [Methanolobus chelungpuianus]|uniref:spore germination protein GerW family protein n=1 Tax=Methanolobus chelungpuianus TaxID=502115 RepID=UPI0021151947|nr:spore germination protein GerW family protein [Methanolobus chelungpuianus]